MKKSFKKFCATGLCLSLLALSVSLAPIEANAAVSNWQKGASIQSRYKEDFGGESFKQSINNLKATGANYVSLIIPYYQSNTGSTDIAPGWNTPSDESLVNAINYIHSKGMDVMLKPHLESYDGSWRAYINPGDRNTWFKNYGDVILYHLADIAQQTGVEEICIGTELISMATYTSNGNNTERWQDLIAGTRSRYSGLLTYSANWGWGDFANEKAHIGFWGNLDHIGISAYFNLNGSGDVATIESNWDNYNKNEIKPLADAHGKPVLFTEVGYRSINDGHNEPWNYGRGGYYDPQNQVNAYTALFNYWNNQSHMVGVHLWEWSSDPNAGGNGDLGYTPQHKPAEETMKSWFGGTGTPDATTTPPVATTTPPVATTTPPVATTTPPVATTTPPVATTTPPVATTTPPVATTTPPLPNPEPTPLPTNPDNGNTLFVSVANIKSNMSIPNAKSLLDAIFQKIRQ